MHQHRSAIIVIGGGSLNAPSVARALAAAGDTRLIIAADSGLDAAYAVGLEPTIVVGDLDSVSDAALARARGVGAEIITFSVDKDHTDTDLALQVAVQRAVTSIWVLGGVGHDRLDHLLATLGVLGGAHLADCDSVRASVGGAEVVVIHGPAQRSIAVTPGATVSLLALHGDCHGVAVAGARWPLNNETLLAGASRGVSNIAESATLDVSVERGVLSVVIPESSK